MRNQVVLKIHGAHIDSTGPRKFPPTKFDDLDERIASFNRGTRVDFRCSVFWALMEDVGATGADFDYAEKRIKSEGLRFFDSALPSLGKGLYQSLAAQHWSHIPSFGRRGGLKDSQYPAFLSVLFKRIFADDGSLLTDACPSAIKFINQICMFAYKADDGSERADLALNKLLHLVKTEEDLELNWNEEVFDNLSGSSIITVSRMVVDRLIKNVPHNFRGSHGPGAVADLDRSTSKFEAPIKFSLRYADLLDRFGFFFNEADKYSRLERYPNFLDGEDPSTFTSEVVLVPKDSRGPRVIAKEPWALQFMQQGIKNWLQSSLELNPFSSGKINFESQEVNQELVRLGSKDKSYSTLDLKDASDRITVGLVKSLFANRPDFLHLLLSTRSTHTSLKEEIEKGGFHKDLPEVIKLQKFSPMGSAMCFPILSVSVFSLAVSSIAIVAKMTIEEASKHVFVYGDDVVVTTKYAETVSRGLEAVGLLINRDKSFIDSYLLESCGVDCFKGFEIQPIRLKDIPSRCRRNDDTSPKPLVGLVERGNSFLHAGYISTAGVIFDLVEASIGNLPMGTPEMGVLNRNVHPEVAALSLSTAMNYLEGRGCYIGRREYQQETFLGFSIIADEVSMFTTAYGHLCRTWDQLGTGRPVSEYGQFTLPRKGQLKRVRFQPDAPTSEWLPPTGGCQELGYS